MKQVWLANRFVRFCAVGLLSLGLSVAMLFLLADVMRLHYLSAFAITFVVMNAGAYTVSRSYVFATTPVTPAIGLLRYFAVTGLGLFVNTAAMAALVALLCLDHILAAVVLAILNAPVNFLLHRRVSFGITRDRIAGLAGCSGTPDGRVGR